MFTAVILALVLAASAGGRGEAEALVRHGESIGELRLGMTLAQVRGLLGPERAVSKRERRGTRGYVYLELDWDYAWWTAGFMRKPGGTFRAVMIGTLNRRQRTPEGVGIGLTKTQLQQRLPGVRCRTEFAVGGAFDDCVLGRGGRQTVFVLERWISSRQADPTVRIAGVEVRDPLYYRGWRGTIAWNS